MRKRRLLLSLISLSVSFVFVVLSTFAWHIVNRNTETSGISINVVSEKLTDVSLTRYVAIQDENEINVYTYGDVLTSDNIKPYDLVEDYTKVIYQFKFTVKNDFKYKLCMTVLEPNRNSILKLKDSEKKYYSNYLSNVMMMNRLDLVENTINKWEVNLDEEYKFGYANEISNEDIVLSTENVYKDDIIIINFLLDYNTMNINRLFSDNLGEDFNMVYFENDIRFYIMEVE